MTIIRKIFNRLYSSLYDRYLEVSFFIRRIRFNLFLLKHFFKFRPFDYAYTIHLLRDALRSQRDYAIKRNITEPNKALDEAVKLLDEATIEEQDTSFTIDHDYGDAKTEQALKLLLKHYRRWWV